MKNLIASIFRPLVVVGIMAIALSAYAAVLNKTLATPFAVSPTAYTTALSSSIAEGNSIFCNVQGSPCKAVGIAVTLKSPQQANIQVQVLVSGAAVSLTSAAQADGSLKFTGMGLGTNSPFPVKVKLKSSSGATITLNPAAGDVLKLHANTLPDS